MIHFNKISSILLIIKKLKFSKVEVFLYKYNMGNVSMFSH